MKNIYLSLIVLAMFSGCVSKEKNHLGQYQIPLEDFFKNPEVRSYQISPDGKYFAYMKPYKNRMNIYVQDVEKEKPEMRLTNQTDRDIAGFFWKGNNSLLYMRDFGGDENFHVFRTSVDGSGEKDLTPFIGVKAQIIDPLTQLESTNILVSLNKRDKRVFDAYRLNVDTGKLTMIAQNPGTYTGWLPDHNGQLRVATSTDGVNTSIFYRDSENKKFKKIITNNFKTAIAPVLFTFDNKMLYALSNKGRDKTALVIFDPIKKKEIKTLYKRDDVDLSDVSYSDKRRVLTDVNYTTWKSQRHFLDKKSEAEFKHLQSLLPNVEIVTSSKTKNEDKFIIRTYSDRSLGSYYLYDVTSKKLEKLAEVSPWINESQMATMSPIQYKSRDGLTINGYLTLPKGGGKNLPMVVLPHGGPWSRDTWGYQPDVQFLANRGYAVLQMNFRGSTGYGRKFWEASFKEWGKKMQDDVTDGVQEMINKGVVNKEKICIYGGSYGGYAVLAGLTFTPDLYACGVDYVGVSNLFTFMETIPPYWTPFLEMVYEMVGHPTKDKKLLKSASPAYHVDKIKAPLMVVQGANDPRVKKSESDQIVEALRKRGIDVPYIVKENEGHGFHNEENKMEMYSKMEEFLNKHLL